MDSKKMRSGYYDGPCLTSRKLTDLLSSAMQKIKTSYKASPASLVEAWDEIIGASFSPFAKAVRFDDGVLYVQVKNSAIMSLLANPADKKRILDQYRMRFPQTAVRNIIFRIGTTTT